MKFNLSPSAAAFAALTVFLSPVLHAAVADLGGWTGVNNQDNGNNYGLISSTSAGGTLRERYVSASNEGAYFADTSLEGGNLGSASNYQAYGRITFDVNTSANPPANTVVTDPIIHLGYFSTADLGNAAIPNDGKGGFAFADSSLTAFRVQTSPTSGATQNTIRAEGTFNFRLEYNTTWANSTGAGTRLRVAFYNAADDPLTATAINNIHVARTGNFTYDAFGIFQNRAGVAPDRPTYGITLSDLTYTGMTPVPEPSSLLMGLSAGSLLLLRRNRRHYAKD